MTNPFSETTSWAYQDNDWLQTQALANGAVATQTYNPTGQLTRLLNQIGGNTLSDFSGIACVALLTGCHLASVTSSNQRSPEDALKEFNNSKGPEEKSWILLL